MPDAPAGPPINSSETLQEQVEGRTHVRKYGTFAGVFTPTLLTILGVIMYLRQGSVVGNAGLGGAWIIIALVCGIIACTALSMSSITTNIRIGAGGAYSIISQSLGLEVGGSVGLPLYLSQALAVTIGIALVSAGFAFRIQYLILAVIVVSLISVFATVFTGDLAQQPELWGDFQGFPETGFQGTDMWFLFALFFPAAGEGSKLRHELPGFARAFRKRGIFARTTFIEGAEPGQGLIAAMQALDGAFFRPNCVFARLPIEEDPAAEAEIRELVRQARRLRTGVILFADHPEARLGRRQSLNVWMREQGPDWELSMRLGNMDMSLLIGHILREAWNGERNVVCIVRDESETAAARQFVERVMDLARLPRVKIRIRSGTMEEQVPRVPTADLDILGLAGEPDFNFARHVLETTASSCLFVRDSGEENVLA